MPASGGSSPIARSDALNDRSCKRVSTGNTVGPRGRSRESRDKSLTALSALGSSKKQGDADESSKRPSTTSLKELWPEVSTSEMEPDDISCSARTTSSMPLNLSERGLMDNYDDIFHRRRTPLNLRVQQTFLNVHDNKKATTTTMEGDLMATIFAPCEPRMRTRSETRAPQEQEGDDKTVPITFRVRSVSPNRRKRSNSPASPRRCASCDTSDEVLESSFCRLQNSLNTEEDKKAYRRGGRSLSLRCLGRKNRSFAVLASVCAVQSSSPPSSSTTTSRGHHQSRSSSNGNDRDVHRRRRGRSPGSLAAAPPTYWEKPSVTMLREATPEVIEQAKKDRMARNDLRASQQSSQAGQAPRTSRRSSWKRLISSTNLFEDLVDTSPLSKDMNTSSADQGWKPGTSSKSDDESARGRASTDSRTTRRRRSIQRSLSGSKDLARSSSFVTGSRIRRTNSGRKLTALSSSHGSSDEKGQYIEQGSLSDDRKARRRRGQPRRNSPIRRSEQDSGSGDDAVLAFTRIVNTSSIMKYTSYIGKEEESSAAKKSVPSVDGWTKQFSHPPTPGDHSPINTNGRRRSSTRTPTRVRTLSPCPSAA